MLGNVINASPAPELTSKPNEKAAGKIMIAARRANIVSEKIIIKALLAAFSFFVI